MLDGPEQTLPVTTNPPGATVTAVDNTPAEDPTQQTPATFNLDRKREYVLTISKEGYKTEQVKIERVVNGSTAGNLLGLTTLGTAIDMSSGAAWKFTPENIVVTLRPLSPSEKVNEANRVHADNIDSQLAYLKELNDAELLTDSQYTVLKDLATQAVSENSKP